MKPRWLNRALLVGPYYTLCLTERDFRQEMDKLRVLDQGSWIATEQADATTHYVQRGDTGALACVVCMRDHAGKDPIVVAGLLVHEAVHIWQKWCEHYGERHPGSEQEAYAIQWLAQELMAEFVRQTGGKA